MYFSEQRLVLRAETPENPIDTLIASLPTPHLRTTGNNALDHIKRDLTLRRMALDVALEQGGNGYALPPEYQPPKPNVNLE